MTINSLQLTDIQMTKLAILAAAQQTTIESIISIALDTLLEVFAESDTRLAQVFDRLSASQRKPV